MTVPACRSTITRRSRRADSLDANREPRVPQRRGFTLAETSMSVFLVSLLVIGSLQSLGASFQNHKFNQSRIRASLLAEQLLVELSCLSWTDPNAPSTAGTIGRDTGDPSAVTRRNQLDDMDDFDDWSESPPVSRDGSVLTGTTGLRRSVIINNLSTTDPTTAVADNVATGIRRVTVIVDSNGTELARVSALLTQIDSAMRSNIYEQRAVPNDTTN